MKRSAFAALFSQPVLRIIAAFAAGWLLFAAVHGLCIDDVYFPGRYRTGLDCHGAAAWFLAGGYICLAIFMINGAAGGVGKRIEKNGGKFQRFNYWISRVGLGLAVIGIAIQLWKILGQ